MIGYDNHVIGHQCVLDLPFEEMSGLVTYCTGKTDIIATLGNGAGASNPAWAQLVSGIPYLEFDLAAPPDYVDAPAADTTGLDFTSGDFSMIVWVNADALTDRHVLMCKGLLNTRGWWFSVFTGGYITFEYYIPGYESVASVVSIIVAGTWYLVGVSRTGTSMRIYRNGDDVTDVDPFTGNPVSSVNDDLNIGVIEDKASYPFDGSMHRPRAWDRYLQPWEHRMVYNMECGMFP